MTPSCTQVFHFANINPSMTSRSHANPKTFWNVIAVRTVIDAPPPQEATLRTNVTLELPCHAIADNSTHVTYQWYFQGRESTINHPVTWISPDNEFIIDPTGLAIDEFRNYTGKTAFNSVLLDCGTFCFIPLVVMNDFCIQPAVR